MCAGGISVIVVFVLFFFLNFHFSFQNGGQCGRATAHAGHPHRAHAEERDRGCNLGIDGKIGGNLLELGFLEETYASVDEIGN